MSKFPEPGPRQRSPFQQLGDEVLDHDRSAARALTAHVARAQRGQRRGAPLVARRVDVAEESIEVVRRPRGRPPKAVTALPELSSEPRKLRTHANAIHEKEERRFDTTALHADLHGKQISHSDYLAHVEKYDYAWRSIKKGDRILDVGCGTDLALLKAINWVQAQATKILYKVGGCYVGVDLNPLKPTGMNWGETIGEVDMTSEAGYDRALRAVPGNAAILDAQTMPDFDLAALDPEDAEDVAVLADSDVRGYTLIVCLEVIEHMEVADGKRLLENFRDLLSPDGRVILSTPVYDGKAMARNHLHEYYVPELQELIESVGLRVVKRMGTFTSEPVIKKWMKENRPDWLALYMESRAFHSAGYLSGLIAPMVPDFSRNNVWLLDLGEA